VLTKVRRRVYEYCDKARSLSEILQALGPGVSDSECHSVLQYFVSARLMIEDNGRYLSLATCWGNGYRKFTDIFPGGAIIQSKTLKRAKQPIGLKHLYWKLRPSLLDIVSLRINLWDIFTAFVRNNFKALKKAIVVLELKTIFFLANLMHRERG
jgi:hypothetical protein